MRLYLKTSPNLNSIPFNYQQKLVGTVHKWIGSENDVHDAISLYSFSWLHGAMVNNGKLEFPNGAKMFVSFYDEAMIRQIMRTILDDPLMFCGLRVVDVSIEDNPEIADRSLFYCGSPVFVKRKLSDGNIKQYTYNDEEVDRLLKETLVTKMRKANLPEDDSLDIRFDRSFPNKKTKLITYRGIGNKASMCPLIINGSPKTKQFAWNVGIGNNTGIGFGSIY